VAFYWAHLSLGANFRSCVKYTRWFKYDRDWLCVNKSQFVPVIFEPPCTLPQESFALSNIEVFPSALLSKKTNCFAFRHNYVKHVLHFACIRQSVVPYRTRQRLINFQEKYLFSRFRLQFVCTNQFQWIQQVTDKLKSSVFWDITRCDVVLKQSFGTVFRSHPQRTRYRVWTDR
jgi:hypothetical protein